MIEEKMRDIVDRDEKTKREVWDRDKAVKHFKKKSAFGLGDRNRKSEKWVLLRIEFCVEPIFPIFFFSKKVKNIL